MTSPLGTGTMELEQKTNSDVTRQRELGTISSMVPNSHRRATCELASHSSYAFAVPLGDVIVGPTIDHFCGEGSLSSQPSDIFICTWQRN